MEGLVIVVLQKRLAFQSCHGKTKVVEDRHRGIVLLRISDDEARIGQSWSHFQRQLQLFVFAKHFVNMFFFQNCDTPIHFHWSMASS